MTAAWPGTLPQEILQEGYTETPPAQAIRSTTDVGPPKVRRRTTAGVRKIQGSIQLTYAEVEILDAFYLTTLAGGSLQFTWVHPRTGAAVTFRFVAEPQYSASGFSFMANLNLEILP